MTVSPESIESVKTMTKRKGLRYGAARMKDGTLLLTDNEADTHLEVMPELAKDFMLAVAIAVTGEKDAVATETQDPNQRPHWWPVKWRTEKWVTDGKVWCDDFLLAIYQDVAAGNDPWRDRDKKRVRRALQILRRASVIYYDKAAHQWGLNFQP